MMTIKLQRLIFCVIGMFTVGQVAINFCPAIFSFNRQDINTHGDENIVQSDLIPKQASARFSIHQRVDFPKTTADYLDLSTVLNTSVGVPDSVKASSQIVARETIKYAEFEITEPHFISTEMRDLFRMDSTNVEMYGAPTAEKLIGEIYVVRNGTFTMPYDCGYRSSIDFVLKKRNVTPERMYRSLAPLIIPDGWTFQHFIDGTLPKIIQALAYLQKPQVKLLMKPPRDNILWEILGKLNITRDKIVLYSNGNYGADYMIFTCNTPPLHPVLWRKARRLLGSPDYLQVPWKDAYVVVVTRAGCFNCGRKFTNMDAVVELLSTKFGNDSVKLFKGPYNLEDTIELFGSAKLIIGAHGGGMVNVVFSPENTHVIEMMPTTKEKPRFFQGADKMIWIQSVLMGQTFWRLPLEPQNSKGDMKVDLTDLSAILDKIQQR